MAGRNTFTLNPYYEGATQTITEVVSASTTYTGYSAPGTATSARKWYISKTERVGGTTYVSWALDGDFAVWDDRTTYFGSTPVPSFINQLSTLFDGVNDYCTADSTPLNQERDKPFTISAWVRPINVTGSFGIVSNYTSTRVGKYLFISNGRLQMFISNAAANTITVNTSAVCVPINQWTHVVLTYSGSQLASGVKIYTNTVNQALTVISDSLTGTVVSNQNLSVGALLFPTAQQFFAGHMDELSLWEDVAMNASQILELYNTGLPGNLANHSQYANLKQWWRMGDGDTYPTLSDSKGTSALTLINALPSSIQAVVP